MSVKVNFNTSSGGGGIMNSPGLGLGLTAAGAFTGQPGLVAGGLSRTKGPIGQAAGVYSTVRQFGGSSGGGKGAISNAADESVAEGSLGTPNYSTGEFGAPKDRSPWSAENNQNALGKFDYTQTAPAAEQGQYSVSDTNYDDYFNSMKRRMAGYGGGY